MATKIGMDFVLVHITIYCIEIGFGSECEIEEKGEHERYGWLMITMIIAELK